MMNKGAKIRNSNRTRSDQHSLSWEQIANLLTSQSQCQSQSHKSNLQNKKLQLKLLDTVFLHQENDDTTSELSSKGDNRQNRIKQWYFTSKKGEVTRRKDPSALTLQHLHDRFCRFSLANSSNAAGPRIIALGYSYDDKHTQKDQKKISCPTVESVRQRVIYTEEQFKREVQHENPFGLSKCAYLQCYLRPFEGKNQFYRGVYQLVLDSSKKLKKSEPNNMDVKSEVLAQIVEDPLVTGNNSALGLGFSVGLFDNKCSTLLKWVQQEVEVSTLKLVTYLESTMSLLPLGLQENNNEKPEMVSTSDVSDHPGRIVALMVDFIMDDNKQLWISCINNVIVSSETKLVEQIYMVSNQYSNQQYNIEQKSVDSIIVLPRISESKESDKLNNDDDKTNLSISSPGNTEQNLNDKQQKSTELPNKPKTDPEENHGDVLQTKVSLLIHSMLQTYLIET